MNMITYVLFLVIIVYICFCKNSSETYYYNSILKATFTRCPQRDGTDLVDVNVIDDIWDVRGTAVWNRRYLLVLECHRHGGTLLAGEQRRLGRAGDGPLREQTAG